MDHVNYHVKELLIYFWKIYSMDTLEYYLDLQNFLKSNKNHLFISVIHVNIEILEIILKHFLLSEVDSAGLCGKDYFKKIFSL